jgi:hypothetical protein
MRILFAAAAIAGCITTFTLLTSSTLQAADIQNGKSQRQEIKAESADVLCLQNDGLPSTGYSYGSDCGFMKRLCCCHHPTAIYHPEIYNYRYFFNIVGHDAYSNSSNHRYFFPAANQPDEILTPVPEQQNQLSQAAGSARLSRPDQKKFQK